MWLDNVPKETVEKFGDFLAKHEYFQPQAEKILGYEFDSWRTGFFPSIFFPVFAVELSTQSNIMEKLLLFFYCCQPMMAKELEKILGQDLFEQFIKYGLIAYNNSEIVETNIQIIPFGNDSFIATERPQKDVCNMQSLSFERDAVMTLFPDSYALARCIDGITESYESALDLFCGNAVQSIRLSKSLKFKRIVGVDVNENALQYARFNAILNKCNNITFLQHDVNTTLSKSNIGNFDVIVANPPFCPNAGNNGQNALYCDGGSDGYALAKVFLHDRLSEVISNNSAIAYMISSFTLRQEESVETKVKELISENLIYDFKFTNLGSSNNNIRREFNDSAIYFFASKNINNMSKYAKDITRFLLYAKQNKLEKSSYGIVKL